MSKRSDKIAHAAHIKERTKGTSNEVSFSVLHAKAQSLDGKKEDIKPARFNSWNPFVLSKGIKRGSLTERSTPVTPSSPVESAAQAASRTRKNDPLLAQKPTASEKTKDSLDALPDKKPAFSAKRAGKGTGSFLDAFKQSKPSALPEAASKPKRSYEEEIAVRKALRKRAKRMAVASVCAMTAGLLAVGSWYGLSQYKSHESSMAEFEESLNLIQEADQTVLAVDELVADPFASVRVTRTGAIDYSSELVRLTVAGDPVSRFQIGDMELVVDATGMNEITADIELAVERLDEADAKARSASEGLLIAEDKEATSQAIFGVEARTQMLATSAALVNPVQSAVECIEIANIAWERLVIGDDFARQASELLGQGSVDEVQASKAKTEEALMALKSSQALFSVAASLYPEADFAPYFNYLAKRIEAMEFAIASDDALIDRNKEEASAQNDAYIAADAEAVELAQLLPSSPEDAVRRAYDESVASSREEYDAARLQAGTADAALREYLGI